MCNYRAALQRLWLPCFWGRGTTAVSLPSADRRLFEIWSWWCSRGRDMMITQVWFQASTEWWNVLARISGEAVYIGVMISWFVAHPKLVDEWRGTTFDSTAVKEEINNFVGYRKIPSSDKLSLWVINAFTSSAGGSKRCTSVVCTTVTMFLASLVSQNAFRQQAWSCLIQPGCVIPLENRGARVCQQDENTAFCSNLSLVWFNILFYWGNIYTSSDSTVDRLMLNHTHITRRDPKEWTPRTNLLSPFFQNNTSLSQLRRSEESKPPSEPLLS